MKTPWPVLALLGSLVSLCIGTSYAKALFEHVGAVGTTTYRIVFSMALLMLLWRPWRRRWQWIDAPPLLLYGGTLGLMNLFFYSSLQTIPFGLSVAIEFTGPLSVALWNSRRALDVLWVVLAAAGLLLILPLSANVAALDPVGLTYCLLAAMCWALYIIFGQRVAQRYGAMATPMGMAVAAVLVTPVGAATVGSALLNPAWIAVGMIVALVSSAIPYTLETYALKHLHKRTFSILLSMEPAIAALAAWFMLAETLTARQILAMAFIMAASIGCAAVSDRQKASASPPASTP